MPAISLVVCVYRERDLLERLLRESQGCYDELLVIHDGPDTTNMRGMVEGVGGRFFASEKREHQQEPHWPFAWGQAKFDWILRLDADEFPSDEMKKWLEEFRRAPGPPAEVSGYTCIWPMWNGRREITKKWPTGRIFLLHRQRVKYFAMPEQISMPDGRYEPLNLVLHHQPKRKSYGLHNILVRKQTYSWREQIATSLLGKPTDLPCWRWESEEWPPGWEQIRQQPCYTAFKRLTLWPWRGLCSQWQAERKIFPAAAWDVPIHHAMICFKYWTKREQNKVDKT